jgi:outer membrane protein assembly factor BamB
MKTAFRIVLKICLGLTVTLSFSADASPNWPQWRGPHENGSTKDGTYPVKWDATKVLWKAALPGKGCSTPIVWEQRIFLTAPVSDQDAALAFDWNGKQLWRTTLGTEKAGKRGNSSGCNPSAVTDGKSVFVYFKSGTLAGLDLAGKVRWQTNLVTAFGAESLFWDQGTSPVLTEDSVVVARMHHGDSWVAAFDKASGQLRWKVARNYETPVEGDNSYTTPLVSGSPGKEVILVYGAEHLTAHAAADGKLLAECDGFNPRKMGYWPTVASPVMAGEIVVVSSGRADRGQGRLHGIRLGKKNGGPDLQRAWERENAGTFVPTPAEYEGKIYIVRDKGEVDCINPADGKTLWHDTMPKSNKSYFSSPTIAGGKMYIAREDGVVFVAKIDGKLELVAENQMEEQIIASPVPAGNSLLLRGDRHLFCVSGQ